MSDTFFPNPSRAYPLGAGASVLAAGADAVLFLRGRVHCLRPEGVKQTTATVGSVLVAYGERNAAALLASGLPGVVMTVRHCTPNTEVRRGDVCI